MYIVQQTYQQLSPIHWQVLLILCTYYSALTLHRVTSQIGRVILSSNMPNQNIKQTLDNLAEVFNSKMAEFQGNLDKADTKNPTVTSVAADFNAFRTFMSSALECLQQQVACLTKQVDHIEVRSRRKMLLIHGVPEVEDEDTVALVVDLCRLRVKCNMTAADLRRCFRTGRPQTGRKRPILVHFCDATLRDKLWYTKTALKGSGIVISEFLTHPRHTAFMAARERFGVDKCWTNEGVIIVLDADGKRHRVTSLAELDGVATVRLGALGPAGTPSGSDGQRRRPKRQQRKAPA